MHWQKFHCLKSIVLEKYLADSIFKLLNEPSGQSCSIKLVQRTKKLYSKRPSYYTPSESMPLSIKPSKILKLSQLLLDSPLLVLMKINLSISR